MKCKCDYCSVQIDGGYETIYPICSTVIVICEGCFKIFSYNGKNDISEIDRVLLASVTTNVPPYYFKEEDCFSVTEKHDVFYIYYKTKKGGL